MKTISKQNPPKTKQKTQSERPKETDASKGSNNTSEWRFPKTKAETKELKELGAKVSLTEQMQFNIEVFLQDIGADEELPTGKKEKIYFLNHWHKRVALQNDHFPEDMGFGFVYGAFFSAILNDRVERHGNNVSAFITAFKNWITQAGVEDNLYRQYYNEYPEEAPMQLEGRGDSETSKEVQANGYVDEPPETVKRLINTLEMMHEGEQEALGAIINESDRSYRRRLYNTKQKYIDEGKWPE